MMILDKKISVKERWIAIIAFAMLVYVLGIILPIMEIDAATYAEVAMEMFDRSDFLSTYSRGMDWLDKPHFQFWITALSYHLFGVNDFGYKFPGLLFSLFSVYFTFLFAKRYYSKTHAWIAALMLFSSMHFIISNSDIRAEVYLTTLTIFSMYVFARYMEEKRTIHFLLGCLGLACLMMTKGIFTIIPVASAVGMTLIMKKQWREIFHWQWLACAAVTLLLLSPTLYGYYQQFDMHPEKNIFGMHEVSGVRFFFWDSQWGRFTNNGPIKGAGDPFFFFHTILWAFAPWGFLAYYAVILKIRKLIKGKVHQEQYTFWGFIVIFMIFTISKFQLPHYLVPLLPFLSILTAEGVVQLVHHLKALKVFKVIQAVQVILLFIAIPLVHWLFARAFPQPDMIIIYAAIFLVVVIIYRKPQQQLKKLLLPPALAMLLVGYYLNRTFYPALLKYQSESEMAYDIKGQNIPVDNVVTLDKKQWIIDFYLHRVIPDLSIDAPREQLSGKYIICPEEALQQLKNKSIDFSIIKKYKDFRITTLSLEFVNKTTRQKTLSYFYLIKT